ncbi:MAG: hypothetical protein U0892_20835 [Pirellulales bacterium]
MTITITQVGNRFDVEHEGRIADGLSFDELLGLVASLTMPEVRPCRAWLKTPEEQEAWRARLTSMAKSVDECVPDPVLLGAETK